MNRAYEELLADVMANGLDKTDRTGTGTRSVFGRQMRFDLSEGFPLITTKKVHFKSIVGELLWFLSGSTNANDLKETYGVSIWGEWAAPNGSLGPVYGKQWRSWGEPRQTELCVAPEQGIDQIAGVIKSIKENPDSRRHIVSAWNVAELDAMALPPCHLLFQFYVRGDKLDLQLYQRSADLFLGVPFNIASYALLLTMVADQTGYVPGEFVWTGGDIHVYSNHFEQVEEQLSRQARPFPTLWRDEADSIDSYTPENFDLFGYAPHPAIKAPVAV